MGQPQALLLEVNAQGGATAGPTLGSKGARQGGATAGPTLGSKRVRQGGATAGPSPAITRAW